MFSSINTIGNSTCHIDVIYATIFVVTVSHFNYLLCAVYKFTTVKLEAEIKKIKTTTSAVLQTVTTTFSDSMDMNMQGHMVYEIAPLTTTIKPIANHTCIIIRVVLSSINTCREFSNKVNVVYRAVGIITISYNSRQLHLLFCRL
jgi:hypothetical protein